LPNSLLHFIRGRPLNGERIAGKADEGFASYPAQHSALRKKIATIEPLMMSPRTAARRSRLRITPSKLKMNPNGAAVTIVSPPRAVMGDPQPGFASHTIKSAAKEASEK
jgi:hypothetical protein